jgi:hypothetical protein
MSPHGRRMGSAHILDLCRCSFPSLSRIQIHHIAIHFLVVCRSSIICFSTQSFESIKLCLIYSALTFCWCSQMICINCSLCTMLCKCKSKTSRSFSLTSFRMFYFKYGRMELSKPVILSRVRWRLRKVYCSCVATCRTCCAFIEPIRAREYRTSREERKLRLRTNYDSVFVTELKIKLK